MKRLLAIPGVVSAFVAYVFSGVFIAADAAGSFVFPSDRKPRKRD